jgi:hypothetical protein
MTLEENEGPAIAEKPAAFRFDREHGPDVGRLDGQLLENAVQPLLRQRCRESGE